MISSLSIFNALTETMETTPTLFVASKFVCAHQKAVLLRIKGHHHGNMIHSSWSCLPPFYTIPIFPLLNRKNFHLLITSAIAGTMDLLASETFILWLTGLQRGVPTQALVDTGSPATIASLEFVLDNFFSERKESQIPAQWREDTEKRFRRPSVLVKAYSGHQLDIMAQLSHGNQMLEPTVLVQDAPNTLFLGTDLQSKLGFALVADTGTKLTDLLTGAECQTDLSELEEPHAEGSKTQMPSQQEEFVADEPETVDPSLGRSELVEIADNPAEKDSGGGDAQEESLTTCEGTPPVAWASAKRVLDPPKEPSYPDTLQLTRYRTLTFPLCWISSSLLRHRCSWCWDPDKWKKITKRTGSPAQQG